MILRRSWGCQWEAMVGSMVVRWAWRVAVGMVGSLMKGGRAAAVEGVEGVSGVGVEGVSGVGVEVDVEVEVEVEVRVVGYRRDWI